MKTAHSSQLLQKLICSLLILLWVYTSLSKLSELSDFTRQLNNQVFGKNWTHVLVWFLPGLELLAAVLLLSDKTKIRGLYLSAALMLIFTIYIALVVFKVFDRTPCSCGGVLKSLSWKPHLAFNLFFLALSLLGIYNYNRKEASAS